MLDQIHQSICKDCGYMGYTALDFRHYKGRNDLCKKCARERDRKKRLANGVDPKMAWMVRKSFCLGYNRKTDVRDTILMVE